MRDSPTPSALHTAWDLIYIYTKQICFPSSDNIRRLVRDNNISPKFLIDIYLPPNKSSPAETPTQVGDRIPADKQAAFDFTDIKSLCKSIPFKNEQIRIYLERQQVPSVEARHLYYYIVFIKIM